MKKRILLIDDDVFFQTFYATHLTAEGYEVQTALNGGEGLGKIKFFQPDIVLLDLIMPEKDGFEVLKTMKKDPLLKQIPVLVFSTLGQEKEIEEAKNLGAAGYINKGLSDFTAANTLIASLLKT